MLELREAYTTKPTTEGVLRGTSGGDFKVFTGVEWKNMFFKYVLQWNLVSSYGKSQNFLLELQQPAFANAKIIKPLKP